MKDQLKQLIARGNTKAAIDQLQEFTKELGAESLQEEVLLLSSKYEQYAREKRLGITAQEQSGMELSRINHSLLQLINALPEEGAAAEKTQENDQIKVSHMTVKDSGQQKKRLGRLLAGFAVVIGILAGISEFTGVNLSTLFAAGSTQSNTVTVLVHGTEGKDELVLPNRGIVKLIYGDAIIPEQINNEGEATFKQVPDAFFESGNKVEILFQDPEGEPYRVVTPDSAYTLKRGQYVGLEVQLEGMDQIHGVVKDFESGDFLEGVTVRALGVDTLTNQFGEFTLKFRDKQEKFVTVRAFKEGYENYERSKVPTTTDKEMAIPMKPKK